MKIIFLDIDGVLITRQSILAAKDAKGNRVDQPDPECVARLNKLLAENDAKVVLSSSWRMGLSIIECRDLLNLWGVTPRVLIDKTGKWQEPRGLEIQEWLDQRERLRGDVESFVILDDERDMAHLLPRLVKTSMDGGLKDEHLPLVKKLFSTNL